MANALAHYLIEPALMWNGRVDRVCAVPLHPVRLRQRGYNQSALLAWPIARALGVRFDPWLVRRRRPTRNQVGLSLQERAANVDGAFIASTRAQHERVLVVDDVLTTGATTAAVAKALIEAGAREVLTLVLARADSDELGSALDEQEC
jgi:ComF family protein